MRLIQEDCGRCGYNFNFSSSSVEGWYLIYMKYLSLLSWNVRGASSSILKKMTRDSVVQSKLNLLCLQETKCSASYVFSVSSLWRSGDFGWADIPDNGLSGGLLYVWDKAVYNLLYCVKGTNWIWCSLESLLENTKFHVVSVYSPQDHGDRKELWDKLLQITL